jgi:hypothetical protein
VLSKTFCVICLIGIGLTVVLASPREPAAATPISDMLRLATTSEFAVIGKIVNTTGIGKRLSKEELLKLDDLSKALGGTLYAVHVEEVITSRADFMNGGMSPPHPGDTVLIFKSRDAPYSPNELYVKGQRYLIFLTPIQNQDSLVKKYELDGGRIYYQAEAPDVGVVQISSASSSTVSKFRQLGAAVKPTDPQQKLKRLKALTRSSDEELREASTEAIRLIQATLHR